MASFDVRLMLNNHLYKDDELLDQWIIEGSLNTLAANLL